MCCRPAGVVTCSVTREPERSTVVRSQSRAPAERSSADSRAVTAAARVS